MDDGCGSGWLAGWLGRDGIGGGDDGGRRMDGGWVILLLSAKPLSIEQMHGIPFHTRK